METSLFPGIVTAVPEDLLLCSLKSSTSHGITESVHKIVARVAMRQKEEDVVQRYYLIATSPRWQRRKSKRNLGPRGGCLLQIYLETPSPIKLYSHPFKGTRTLELSVLFSVDH